MKPQIIEKLVHDKAITKANYPEFVETFNYTVSRVENIKGDFDINPIYGHIRVDNTDPEHPVLRLENLQEISSNINPGPWEISSNSVAYEFSNCAIRLARSYFFFPNQTLNKTISADHFILLGVDHTNPPQIHLSCTDVQTGKSILSGGNYLSSSIQPLYLMSNGNISVDYRSLLNIQAYDNRQVEYNPPWEQ